MTRKNFKLEFTLTFAFGAILSIWYTFDKVVGSSISREWSNPDTLHSDVEADDGTTLGMLPSLG